MKKLLSLIAISFSLAGCLNFELDLTFVPGGRFVAATTLNAPVWLGRSWYGSRAVSTDLTRTMLAQMPVRGIQLGNGAWITADHIDQFKTPFLTFKYKEHKDDWQLWGILEVSADELSKIREELGSRSQKIPKVHGERAEKLAGAMFSQAQFKVYVRPPGPVTYANIETDNKGLLTWVVGLEDLEEGNGKAFMTLSGTRDWTYRAVAMLDLLLPPGEID